MYALCKNLSKTDILVRDSQAPGGFMWRKHCHWSWWTSFFTSMIKGFSVIWLLSSIQQDSWTAACSICTKSPQVLCKHFSGTACGSKEIISSHNLFNILREVVAMKIGKVVTDSNGQVGIWCSMHCKFICKTNYYCGHKCAVNLFLVFIFSQGNWVDEIWLRHFVLSKPCFQAKYIPRLHWFLFPQHTG